MSSLLTHCAFTLDSLCRHYGLKLLSLLASFAFTFDAGWNSLCVLYHLKKHAVLTSDWHVCIVLLFLQSWYHVCQGFVSGDVTVHEYMRSVILDWAQDTQTNVAQQDAGCRRRVDDYMRHRRLRTQQNGCTGCIQMIYGPLHRSCPVDHAASKASPAWRWS